MRASDTWLLVFDTARPSLRVITSVEIRVDFDDQDITTTQAGPDHAPADQPSLVDFEQAANPLEEALEQERAHSRAALARVREVLLASEPAISPELVTGDTLAEIEASFTAARDTVERARASVASPPPPPSVGAGAPGRLPPPRATPFEKIRQGLARR